MIEPFGRHPDGTEVQRIGIDGPALRISVLTFGAALQRIEVPDHAGDWANVALGLDSLDGYVNDSPHFGAVPGRFAGRIAGGRFVLDGTEYRLACNDGPNALHGGPSGFGKRVWRIEDSSQAHVTLGLTSPDGDEGYPGTLEVRVTYTVDGGDLRIDYRAWTDRATVLNLTNHSYFNLRGEGSGSVLDHTLQVDADAFLPADATSLPTGQVRPVDGTPFDFRTPTLIGDRIRTGDEQLLRGLGYDHCWLLRPVSGLRRAARLCDPTSGRTLEVLTTEPAIQVYTANKLTGALTGPGGRTYRQGDAVCLETQHVPDSPNQPAFPSTVLRSDGMFISSTVFRFDVTPQS